MNYKLIRQIFFGDKKEVVVFPPNVELPVRLVMILTLVFLLGLGFYLRVYKVEQIPPAISWDEAANGYNAWAIGNFGKDEWGERYPAYFKSFRDDKHPVHIYLTAISIKALGLSEFSTRLPAAIFGTLNILMLYLVTFKLFKHRLVALLAAVFMTLSPYGIQFSRFSHELHFTIFFFLLGLYLFLVAIEAKASLLLVSAASFGLCLITYHSAKVIVPPMLLALILLYLRQLWSIGSEALAATLVLISFGLLLFFQPALLGTARAKQTALPTELIQQTDWYKQTNNELLGRVQLVWRNYQTHFTPNYLFISGDTNKRHATQITGQFYPIDGGFMLLGVVVILWLLKKQWRSVLVLLLLILLAPLPASLVQEAPHASRAMFMLPSLLILAALGLGYTSEWLARKKVVLQSLLLVIVLMVIGGYALDYQKQYFTQYAKAYAIEWQYGMREIVQFVKQHPEYMQVYMVTDRMQPYIFFLYYLQTPPDLLLSSVAYDSSRANKYNTVAYYDKYYFGGWDVVESIPSQDVLYIVTASQYTGLRHKDQFKVKKQINYPDGKEAFYLVSGG